MAREGDDDGDAEAGPAPVAVFDGIAGADPERGGSGTAPVARFETEQLGAARPEAPVAEFGKAVARRARRPRRPTGADGSDGSDGASGLDGSDGDRTEPASTRGRSGAEPAARRRRHPSFGVPILPIGRTPSTEDHRSRAAARRRRADDRRKTEERPSTTGQFELLSGGAPVEKVDDDDRIRIGVGGGLVNARVAESDRAEWKALARLAEQAQAREDRARALRIAVAKATGAGRTIRVDHIEGGVRVGHADAMDTTDDPTRAGDAGCAPVDNTPATVPAGTDPTAGTDPADRCGPGERLDPAAAVKRAAATPSTRDLADLWAQTLAEQRQRLTGEPSEPPCDADGTPKFGPYADPVSVARNICLRLLTERARTRHELADALHRKGVPEDAALAVLERFSDVGLIDDAAFAEQWVRSRHAGRGLGRRALAVELRRKGVAEELAGAVLETLDDEAEERRARQLVDRKLRTMTLDDREQRAAAMRRLAGMLARRGYSSGIAYRVVREAIAAHGADADELGGADDVD